MPNISQSRKLSVSVDCSDMMAQKKRDIMLAVAKTKARGLTQVDSKSRGFDSISLGIYQNGLDYYNVRVSKFNSDINILLNSSSLNPLTDPVSTADFFTSLEKLLINNTTSDAILLTSSSLTTHYQSFLGNSTTPIYALTTQNIIGNQTVSAEAIAKVPSGAAVLLPQNNPIMINGIKFEILGTPASGFAVAVYRTIKMFGMTGPLVLDSVVPAPATISLGNGQFITFLGAGSSGIATVNSAASLTYPTSGNVISIAGDGTFSDNFPFKDGEFNPGKGGNSMGLCWTNSVYDSGTNAIYFGDVNIDTKSTLSRTASKLLIRKFDVATSTITTLKDTGFTDSGGGAIYKNGEYHYTSISEYSSTDLTKYIVVPNTTTSFTYVKGDKPRVIKFDSTTTITLNLTITLPADWETDNTGKYADTELCRVYSNHVQMYNNVTYILNGTSFEAPRITTNAACNSIYRPGPFTSTANPIRFAGFQPKLGIVIVTAVASYFKYNISTGLTTNICDLSTSDSRSCIVADNSGNVYIVTYVDGASSSLIKLDSAGNKTILIKSSFQRTSVLTGAASTINSEQIRYLCYFNNALYYINNTHDGNWDTTQAWTNSVWTGGLDAIYKLDLATNVVSLFSGTVGRTYAALNAPTWNNNYGSASTIQFGYINSFAIDSTGKMYVYDYLYGSILRISSGNVSLIAGGGHFDLSGSMIGYKDGPVNSARFSFVTSMVINETAQCIYAFDPVNGFLRQVSLVGAAIQPITYESDVYGQFLNIDVPPGYNTISYWLVGGGTSAITNMNPKNPNDVMGGNSGSLTYGTVPITPGTSMNIIAKFDAGSKLSTTQISNKLTNQGVTYYATGGDRITDFDYWNKYNYASGGAGFTSINGKLGDSTGAGGLSLYGGKGAGGFCGSNGTGVIDPMPAYWKIVLDYNTKLVNISQESLSLHISDYLTRYNITSLVSGSNTNSAFFADLEQALLSTTNSTAIPITNSIVLNHYASIFTAASVTPPTTIYALTPTLSNGQQYVSASQFSNLAKGSAVLIPETYSLIMGNYIVKSALTTVNGINGHYLSVTDLTNPIAGAVYYAQGESVLLDGFPVFKYLGGASSGIIVVSPFVQQVVGSGRFNQYDLRNGIGNDATISNPIFMAYDNNNLFFVDTPIDNTTTLEDVYFRRTLRKVDLTTGAVTAFAETDSKSFYPDSGSDLVYYSAGMPVIKDYETEPSFTYTPSLGFISQKSLFPPDLGVIGTLTGGVLTITGFNGDSVNVLLLSQITAVFTAITNGNVVAGISGTSSNKLSLVDQYGVTFELLSAAAGNNTFYVTPNTYSYSSPTLFKFNTAFPGITSTLNRGSISGSTVTDSSLVDIPYEYLRYSGISKDPFNNTDFYLGFLNSSVKQTPADGDVKTYTGGLIKVNTSSGVSSVLFGKKYLTGVAFANRPIVDIGQSVDINITDVFYPVADKLNPNRVYYVSSANANNKCSIYCYTPTRVNLFCGNGASFQTIAANPPISWTNPSIACSQMAFGEISAMISDSLGNLYVTDNAWNSIFKITPSSQTVTLVAGLGTFQKGTMSSNRNRLSTLEISNVTTLAINESKQLLYLTTNSPNGAFPAGYIWAISLLEIIIDDDFTYSDSTHTVITGYSGGGNARITPPAGTPFPPIHSRVTSITANAFKGCSGFIGSLVIPNTIISIGTSAFQGCSGFNGTLTLSSSLTQLPDGVFQGCDGFVGSLTIPTGITRIGVYSFYNCSRFTGSLTIPNGVTAIDVGAFQGCYGFNGTLTLPSSLLTVGRYAFSSCNLFTGSLIIPNGVTLLDSYSFEGCFGFNGTLTLPSSLLTIGIAVFRNCTNFIGSLTIPNSVQTIMDEAFINCANFNGTLTFGTGLTQVGAYAFFACSGFTGSLTFPSGVTYIGGYAFQGCTGFNGTLTFPSNLLSIGIRAFYGCNGFPTQTVRCYAAHVNLLGDVFAFTGIRAAP